MKENQIIRKSAYQGNELMQFKSQIEHRSSSVCENIKEEYMIFISDILKTCYPDNLIA